MAVIRLYSRMSCWSTACERLTNGEGAGARWLPALPPWDWTRAKSTDNEGVWLAYTCGLNEGGIGGNNANTLRTNVYLTKLSVP